MDAQRIRVIHTADLHLDSSFAPLGVNSKTGNVLREAQLKVFENVLIHAVHWSADAVCIAGDLFDQVHVGQPVLDRVMAALEHIAPLPVYITPGNRDPFTPESPYALEVWPENVTVFSPENWHAAEHETRPLTIHGRGFDGTEAPEKLFADLQIPRDGRVHIGVVHATEQDHKPPEGKVFSPFKACDIPGGLSYLALGHFHNLTAVDGPHTTVIRYPGTPQGRTFVESGPRHVLQVEFLMDETQQIHVTATPLDLAEVLFEVLDLELARADHAASLFDARVAEDARRQVALIRLNGVRPPLAGGTIARLRETARGRFLHAEVADETIMDASSLVPTRDNTCLSKLMDMMGKRILDETIRETALREAEALELVLSACLNGEHTDGEEGAIPYAD